MNGTNGADHIRNFIQQNMKHSFEWYSVRLGCAKETLIRFINNGRNSRIDIVEMFLNEIGYTLTVKPLGTEDGVDMYREGYKKGKADMIEDIIKYSEIQRK